MLDDMTVLRAYVQWNKDEAQIITVVDVDDAQEQMRVLGGASAGT